VGAEVSIGSFLVNYLKESNIGNMPEEQAGFYLSYYWGGLMVGRFLGSYLLTKLNPGKYLAFNAVIAAGLVITTILSSGLIAVWSVIFVGLFNAAMFPIIFTLGLSKLGKHTKKASGILIMAIVGGAVVPVIQGAFADMLGIHLSFIVPVACYFYITYYGIKGSIIKLV
jgi:FHS family L-fucose permease-like MFS transporter